MWSKVFETTVIIWILSVFIVLPFLPIIAPYMLLLGGFFMVTAILWGCYEWWRG